MEATIWRWASIEGHGNERNPSHIRRCEPGSNVKDSPQPFPFPTLPFCKVVFLGNISVSFSVHSCLPRAPTKLRPKDRCGKSGFVGSDPSSLHRIISLVHPFSLSKCNRAGNEEGRSWGYLLSLCLPLNLSLLTVSFPILVRRLVPENSFSPCGKKRFFSKDKDQSEYRSPYRRSQSSCCLWSGEARRSRS